MDRFSGSDDSRLEAHRHNAAVLMELLDDIAALPGVQGRWKAVVADAIAEHATLSGVVRQPIKPPASLKAYLKD